MVVCILLVDRNSVDSLDRNLVNSLAVSTFDRFRSNNSHRNCCSSSIVRRLRCSMVVVDIGESLGVIVCTVASFVLVRQRHVLPMEGVASIEMWSYVLS